MPYVNIRVTREGVTAAQKLALIEGTTELLQRVLNKSPSSTRSTPTTGAGAAKPSPPCASARPPARKALKQRNCHA